jgi:glycosyltransferase involved in cell wall biosynthesis
MTMRPVTVLHALEKASFATGSVWQMFEAARGLAQRGHRVLVATRPDQEMARRCREAGLVHLPLSFWNEFDLYSMRRLAGVIRRQRVQVVHAHKGIAHAVALGAAVAGARFGLIVNRGVSFPISPLAAYKYRSPHVHRIVAVCDAIRRHLVDDVRVAADRVVVIPGGVDVHRFSAAVANPRRVRRELRLPARARVIGTIGVRDWKGWKEVLQALPEVRGEHPEARLLLVGCESERQRRGVLRLADEMGLADAVIPTLTRDDMPDVLAACDVVVDASWAGTGTTGTIREAMSLGRPVIATAIAGNGELVEDGVTGILVPPRDVKTLAAAISRLLRDDAFAADLAQAGRTRVRAQFSTTTRVLRLEALYREVIREVGPATVRRDRVTRPDRKIPAARRARAVNDSPAQPA